MYKFYIDSCLIVYDYDYDYKGGDSDDAAATDDNDDKDDGSDDDDDDDDEFNSFRWSCSYSVLCLSCQAASHEIIEI